MENNSILEKVNELKNTYYSDNGKNVLFKNKQKFECANNIINSIGIDDLIRKTIYIIQDTNNVYIDYTLFKLFATPEQYNRIVDYAISAINFSINKYGSYEVHINLDTFTVSAAERYKHIIIIFLNSCRDRSLYSGCFSLNRANVFLTNNVVYLILNRGPLTFGALTILIKIRLTIIYLKFLFFAMANSYYLSVCFFKVLI